MLVPKVNYTEVWLKYWDTFLYFDGLVKTSIVLILRN